MKLFFKEITKKGAQIWVKLEGKPAQHVLDKVPGFPVLRCSKYSFFYKDKLYDMKKNLIIPKMSNSYKKYVSQMS